MRQIPGAKLWIDEAGGFGNRSALEAAEIAAVVDLTNNEPLYHPVREPLYLAFPIVDGAGNSPELLRQAVDAVAALIRDDVPTLLRCDWRMSRSVAIAAAALAKAHDKDPNSTAASICRDMKIEGAMELWFDIESATGANVKLKGAKHKPIKSVMDDPVARELNNFHKRMVD